MQEFIAVLLIIVSAIAAYQFIERSKQADAEWDKRMSELRKTVHRARAALMADIHKARESGDGENGS